MDGVDWDKADDVFRTGEGKAGGDVGADAGAEEEWREGWVFFVDENALKRTIFLHMFRIIIRKTAIKFKNQLNNILDQRAAMWRKIEKSFLYLQKKSQVFFT